MNRHTAREKAFQLLFQLDINDTNPTETVENYVKKEKNDPFLKTLVEGTMSHKSEIEQIISQHLEKWSFKRLATVEKTILRIATYEITFLDDIPTNVSINEAIELANKFGDDKSGKFVNGVLSKIVRGR